MTPFVGIKPLAVGNTFDSMNKLVGPGDMVLYPSVSDKIPQLTRGMVTQVEARMLCIEPMHLLDPTYPFTCRRGNIGERFHSVFAVPNSVVNITDSIDPDDLDRYTQVVQSKLDFTSPTDRAGIAYRYVVDLYHNPDNKSDRYVVVAETAGSTSRDLEEVRWNVGHETNLTYGGAGIRFSGQTPAWVTQRNYWSSATLTDTLMAKRKLSTIGFDELVNMIIPESEFTALFATRNPKLSQIPTW